MITVKDMKPYLEKSRKEREESNKKLQEVHRKELEAKGVKFIEEEESEPTHFDHPNTMENGQATALYILVMLIGLIFNARWLIWIFATVVYFKFITRHKK